MQATWLYLGIQFVRAIRTKHGDGEGEEDDDIREGESSEKLHAHEHHDDNEITIVTMLLCY